MTVSPSFIATGVAHCVVQPSSQLLMLDSPESFCVYLQKFAIVDQHSYLHHKLVSEHSPVVHTVFFYPLCIVYNEEFFLLIRKWNHLYTPNHVVSSLLNRHTNFVRQVGEPQEFSLFALSTSLFELELGWQATVKVCLI